jgi:ferredoxin-thioredoxin reductase catalytic subunit
MSGEVTKKQIDELYARLKKEAEASGYNLNPDVDFTKDLIKGLVVNNSRYGYGSCPCRLAKGEKEKDLDIICPCDYRDPDLIEYGSCYCGLYVSDEIKEGKKELVPVPERRGKNKNREPRGSGIKGLGYPVFRCRVCGYLCARENPPGICPICKAKSDRFEKFI